MRTRKVFQHKQHNGARVAPRISRSDWLALFRQGKATIHEGKAAVLLRAEPDQEVYQYVCVL